MLLTYILDEHLRGKLWKAIQQHNASSAFPIDALQVGDAPDLPLRSSDPDILLWAEREGQVVVTRDYSTMLGYLTAHLRAGNHSASLFIIRSKTTIPQIVDYLAAAAYAGDPTVSQDGYQYIP